MAIALEDGTRHTREVIKIEYEWKPPHCNDCKIFGHSNAMCPKRVNLDIAFDNSDKVTKIAREPIIARSAGTNGDGFTEVKREKNKGTNMRGADLNNMPHVSADVTKKKDPSTSNSFDALNNMEVGADCEESSSKGIHQEESVAESYTSKCNEDHESDEDMDEKLDIRLEGQVRK
ncbi:hypothetical protein Tco_0432750 [Tanacetum coccineum]